MYMYDPKDIGVGNDITALAPYFRLGLDLTRAQDEEAEKPWQIDQDLTDVQIPKYLETLLEDFALGLGTGDCDARLIRPRLSAILMALLAKVMKETCISRVDDEDPATESASNSERPSVDYSTPCWIVDQKLILPPVTDFVTDPVEITMHFILLYGCRPNLDTNVIVLRKQTIVPDEGWGVLAAMSAIHRQRKEAGDNGDIYGIHTDTYTWNFFHLNDSGKYSTKLDLSWYLDQKEVIGRVCHIIREAATLSREVGGRDPMLGVFEPEAEDKSDDEKSDQWSLY
ncbi:beta-ketoacyl synthase, N-terminal domain family protein [Aspergillus tubingensis]|uniref:beta-ketoacyl synthase, N-terminal domain family protein n=1 Tax=Aspergillus tubingensis TaxID=5068 RepID=UPI001577C80C|nr:beta-ketoacyl synthase, N-terminal domain family protein [Aspergillus tubingensis]GFN12423.1 beta-ketoacyl synthase, N-terminal domain family protein [Aspergillus tubingensis]